MAKKFKVGIVGATGMVGQRFVSLLADHPWFDIALLSASARSAGKTYAEAVNGRWVMSAPMPGAVAQMSVLDASDISAVKDKVDFIFCAINLDKTQTKALEEEYAKAEIPVVSNNSAHRGTQDVPMLMPEINAEHIDIIPMQRKRLGTQRGFIAVKPNCSIQTYVPALHPLMDFGIEEIAACTYQAISGAGKTFESWPEMVDNVIPYIGGEEQKSEQEPLKIWGHIEGGEIRNADLPVITSQCIRVASSDGHMAATFVRFRNKPPIETIRQRWQSFQGLPQQLGLPSAPKQFLQYFEDETRPQTRLDRDNGKGMAVSIGRLREDPIFDYKFVCLSHNTLRGAAGGAVLVAELLAAKGYFDK
ncbi:MAG: aspartate-semialdehyde dehydrogenase [Eubacteriales bacterium]|nr:aspartate-semialdehyde dehydrogenase [Eubacteriales bacterium]